MRFSRSRSISRRIRLLHEYGKVASAKPPVRSPDGQRDGYQVYSSAMKSRTKSHTHFAALLCAFAASLHCVPLSAQDRDPAPSRAAAVLDSMPHAKKIDQVALSPDGTQVAYIVDGQLTVTPVRGGSGSLQAISVEGKLPLRDVTWSADSKHLAFLADLPGDIPIAQVWTAAIDGRAPAKRAELKGYAQTPRFSPDGANLAILFTKDLPRVAGPLQPMTPLAGVIDDQIYEQRLTTINLSTNHLAQVTPADVYIYEYDWTPDGTAWAATAAHGSGDANWWVARLYRINAQSGEMHEIYAPKWQMEDPHVSPDGKNVALIEGLMSDAGVTGGDIFVVPINGPSNGPATAALRGISLLTSRHLLLPSHGHLPTASFSPQTSMVTPASAV